MNKTKLLMIEEGTKFFNFTEKMEQSGKRTGTVKLKDGTTRLFEYIGFLYKDNGKKVHYIKI